MLATDYLSFADRAAIWRSYATAVVGLCKDVKELKELIEDGELGSMVTELIEEEWLESTNWQAWHRSAMKDLERQVNADPALREKLDEEYRVESGWPGFRRSLENPRGDSAPRTERASSP